MTTFYYLLHITTINTTALDYTWTVEQDYTNTPLVMNSHLISTLQLKNYLMPGSSSSLVLGFVKSNTPQPDINTGSVQLNNSEVDLRREHVTAYIL